MDILDVRDVKNLDDLPETDENHRYFDFIHGEGFRCFLVHKDTPRGLFMEKYEDELDECLKPIYKNQGICTRQDGSYGVPGFYIISPTENFHSMDHMDDLTFMRMQNLIKKIRAGMREVLGINFVHIYYEEKDKKSCNVHIWILPIFDIKKHPRIYNFDLMSYLDSFGFKENRQKILEYNTKLRDWLTKENFLDYDNKLIKNLNNI